MLRNTLLIAFFLSNACLYAEEGYDVRLIKNSKSFSQVIAVNANLEVLGVREVADGPTSALRNFFRRGDSEIELQPPKEFTNLEVQALSDTGLVVGYLSRNLGNVDGSLHAFMWDSKTKQLVTLSPLEGDLTSHAQDINADGTRITGYSTGNNPSRMRPCVWEWKAEAKSWKAVELPSIVERNPYLQASQVVISPNGKRIAASITEAQLAEFAYDSSLFVWEREKDGNWQSRKVSDEQPKLKDINDDGVMVGSISDGVTTQACRIELSGKTDHLGFLPGDVSSTAYGITNSGVIIGYSDDAPGDDGGPQAFVWKSGVLSALALPDDTVDSAALTINQQGVVGGFILQGESPDASISAFIATPKRN